MIRILAELDARHPSDGLPFDPRRMTRAYLIQDSQDRSNLYAVTEYPAGLGVVYPPGNMAYHGGAGGRQFLEAFGRWLQVCGVPRVTVHSAAPSVYMSIKASNTFDPRMLEGCSPDDTRAITEQMALGAGGTPSITVRWLPTGSGERCEASASVHGQSMPIRLSLEISAEQFDDFQRSVGYRLGINLRGEVEELLRSYVRSALFTPSA